MQSAPAVDVDEVDAGAALAGEGTDDGAQRGGGAAAAADDLAQVVGVHAHLEDRAATQLLVADVDVVGVADDAADQVLECLGQQRSGSRRACRRRPRLSRRRRP